MLVFIVLVAAGLWGYRPLHNETRALIFVDDLQYLSLRRIFRQTIEGPSLFFLFRPLSVLSLIIIVITSAVLTSLLRSSLVTRSAVLVAVVLP